MKSIKLVYWKVKIVNYGDLLSPYLITKLSGCSIVHKNYACGNWKSHLYYLINSIVHLDWGLKVPYLFPFEKHVVAIGSILSYSNKSSHIWGSGFMSKEEHFNGGKVHAVRGKLSLVHLVDEEKMQGRKLTNLQNVSLGDPALLLPIVYNPSIQKNHKIGIIPHFSEQEYFEKTIGDKYHVISMMKDDIETVTNEILSCEYILSSSLHGIIVAHAYGIPALWIEYSGLEEGTKGFKFNDYFSAVNIEPYQPLNNLNEVFADESTVMQTFNIYEAYSLPNCDIKQVQNNLINCAPFKILEQYK